MMSPKQAIVVGAYSVVCLLMFSVVFCDNADAILSTMERYDTGRLYLLMWALPLLAFASLALASATVLVEGILRRGWGS